MHFTKEGSFFHLLKNWKNILNRRHLHIYYRKKKKLLPYSIDIVKIYFFICLFILFYIIFLLK